MSEHVTSGLHHHGPPPPPEPKSPMWLPALGAALFLLAGVWWMLTPPFGEISPEAPAAAPANDNPAAVAPAGGGAPGGAASARAFLQKHVPK